MHIIIPGKNQGFSIYLCKQFLTKDIRQGILLQLMSIRNNLFTKDC